MLAEPTTYPAQPATPPSWLMILGLAIAVLVGSGLVGLIGGGLLFFGLLAWLAGPEALAGMPYNHEQLPAAAQALLLGDGLFLCASLVAAPVAVVLLLRVVPRPDPNPREYLGLKWPGLLQGLSWGLLILGGDFVLRFLVPRLGMPLGGDDSFREIIDTPVLFPLAFVAIAVLAPVVEELLVRGYLLEGFRVSRFGETGAILITSALWAGMHSGTPARLLGIFLVGILLALARLRTGSTYLTVTVHAIVNTVAVILAADW